MEQLWHDLRFGWRTAIRNPGVSALIVVSLGLGIGANTAIFTLIEKVVFQPLPLDHPEKLVLFDDDVNQGVATGGELAHWSSFSYPVYEYFRDHNKAFENLCGFQKAHIRLSLRWNGSIATELARGQMVSANYFEVFGVDASRGRLFRRSDDVIGAPAVAVISYLFWQKSMNQNPSVVGQTVFLNDVSFTIIGVAPPQFHGERVEDPPDFWMPLTTQPQVMPDDNWLSNKTTFWLNLMGRLGPDTDLKKAESTINVQLKQFLSDEAGTEVSPSRQREILGAHVELKPGARGISTARTTYSNPLFILMALVFLILLLACANASSMLLARIVARRQELSLRAALGASRSRMVAQLFTESLMFSLAAAVAGIALALSTTKILLATLGTGSALDVAPDWRILLFTLAISIFTGFLVGLLPALQTGKANISDKLKGPWAGFLRNKIFHPSNILVIFQMAISLLLLLESGLLIRSIANLTVQDLGFEGESVLVMHIDPRLGGYKASELGALYPSLLDRVSALPGVTSASLATFSPMSGFSQSVNVFIPGRAPSPGEKMRVLLDFVAPKHFETLGTPVLLGREVGLQDVASAPLVAVVNESFKSSFFPDVNPIGRRFHCLRLRDIEIVGVVKNSKYKDLRAVATPMVFLSLAQAPGNMGFARDLEVRTSRAPLSVVPEIRQSLNEIGKSIPVDAVATVSGQVAATLERERLSARICSFFAVLALVLSAVGLYGVVGYSVRRRTREIGTRIALGARRRNILWMVMGESLRLVCTGAVLGVLAAFGAGRLIKFLFFGVAAVDPLTAVSAILILLVVAGIATYVPALQASRVDPMAALRYE